MIAAPRDRLLVAFLSGFFLQACLPAVFAILGLEKAAWLSMYPGLLPILWATRGWFAGISPLGYLILYSVNTLVYGTIIYLLLLLFCRQKVQISNSQTG